MSGDRVPGELIDLEHFVNFARRVANSQSFIKRIRTNSDGSHSAGPEAVWRIPRSFTQGGTVSGAIQNQQLVPDEDGLGHHAPGAARTGEPGNRRQQMEKQDGQIAHGPIVTGWRNPKLLRNWISPGTG
jgi:hypothetical protein